MPALCLAPNGVRPIQHVQWWIPMSHSASMGSYMYFLPKCNDCILFHTTNVFISLRIINLSHCCHMIPLLFVWVGCTTILCQLFHTYPEERKLRFCCHCYCAICDVKMFGYITPVLKGLFVCTPNSHYHHYAYLPQDNAQIWYAYKMHARLILSSIGWCAPFFRTGDPLIYFLYSTAWQNAISRWPPCHIYM